jgi:hypothetical protein
MRNDEVNFLRNVCLGAAFHNFRHAFVIPRLSKAGMPSRSEGWGGLFKDESTD